MGKTKVMFFIPHPDDLEFGAALVCIEALKAGMEVIEVMMTGGEYGTKQEGFKGKRLRKIRSHELDNTAKVYGQRTGNPLRIIRMGFIDGHLPLNKQALNKVVDLIKKEKPDIIFAPDPFYPMDFHPDHINTGRLPFFALKHLEKEQRPKRFFFFYSFKKNRAIKCGFKNIKIAHLAMLQHRSQVTPFGAKIFYGYSNLLFLIKILRHRGFARRYRELYLNIDLNSQSKIKTIKDRIKYVFFRKWISGLPMSSEDYHPNPEELGLI